MVWSSTRRHRQYNRTERPNRFVPGRSPAGPADQVGWGHYHQGWMKVLFAANFALLLALFPIFSGLIQRVLVMTGNEWPAYQEFLNHRHGLLQRIAALAVVSPIGVGSYFLARHAGGPTR